MSDTPLVFVDTETTGLDPNLHEIWEVGMILTWPESYRVPQEERTWLLGPVNVANADPKALSIGRFADRHPQGQHWTGGREEYTLPAAFSHEFVKLTKGAHLIGAVVSFDEERLRRLLLGQNVKPEWHYHLVDVEALVAGKLGIEPPWNSNDLSRAVGLDPDQFHRHEALEDARWAKALYEIVMN